MSNIKMILFQTIQLSIRTFSISKTVLFETVQYRVIPKILKMVLDITLLNTQQYKVRIKVKVDQSWEKSSALPTPRCCSYWKGSLLVALDYGRQLYFVLNTVLWSKTDLFQTI